MPRSSLGIDEGDAGALCTSLRPAKALILAVVTCVISGSFNFGYFTGIMCVLGLCPTPPSFHVVTFVCVSAGAAVYIQDSYPESSFWKGALVSCILLGAMAGATLSGRLANAVVRCGASVSAVVSRVVWKWHMALVGMEFL